MNKEAINPLVSICIPTYNGAKFLESTLNSVFEQTYEPIEIVIVDDQSSDETLEIVKNFHQPTEGKKILWSLNPTTKGMALNWNETISRASGKYVKVMGQDDLLDKDCIHKQVECLEKNEDLSLVACARKIIRPNGKPIFNRVLFKKSQVLDGALLSKKSLDFGSNYIGEPVTVLAARKTFLNAGGFDDRFNYFIDVDMWIKIMKTGSVFYEIEPLCGFRIHQDSVTFNVKKKIYQELEVLREIYPDFYQPPRFLLKKVYKRLRWEFFVMARNLVYYYFGMK